MRSTGNSLVELAVADGDGSGPGGDAADQVAVVATATRVRGAKRGQVS
jgi:hypothetical protein